MEGDPKKFNNLQIIIQNSTHFVASLFGDNYSQIFKGVAIYKQKSYEKYFPLIIIIIVLVPFFLSDSNKSKTMQKIEQQRKNIRRLDHILKKDKQDMMNKKNK
ncbi:hypothetical protein M0812_06038 [Anaeramoeba flamelloides]|uniref:Transmembrane protein n=1 Tax=Anaeramoeba flamelloides TaxID=1746091 RepID=A0AAV8A7T2_9EUKA|nr:hypothetical protein M0812_06038 [Anaeramoeba flamelloides]